jgi:hypothetical protein
MHHDADDEPTVASTWPAPERRGSRGGRHARRARVIPWITALLASAVVMTLGVLAINTFVRPLDSAAASDSRSVLALGSGREVATPVSRDFVRPGPSLSTESTAPAPSASAQPAKRKPVAGLNQTQMDNAVAIVEAGKRMNVPKRAHVVALVTALQETRLRNLANKKVPASLNLPNQGLGADFDSIGLFQQRPSQGWGTAAELMDPATAAGRFYGRLVKVGGWETMTVGAAAQAVQRSAFPRAYDKHQAQAQKIVDAIA